MPVEDLERTPSNKLAEYYGVEHPELRWMMPGQWHTPSICSEAENPIAQPLVAKAGGWGFPA